MLVEEEGRRFEPDPDLAARIRRQVNLEDSNRINGAAQRAQAQEAEPLLERGRRRRSVGTPQPEPPWR